MATLYGLARLGRDAEVRFTQGGDAVASLSLAFTCGKKDESGKRPTQWVDGALWGKRAESLAPYLLKGGLIVVTLDDVHLETFQGKNGPSTKLAGKVSNIELAGGPPPTAAPTPKPAPKQATKPATDFSDMDDDVPF